MSQECNTHPGEPGSGSPREEVLLSRGTSPDHPVKRTRVIPRGPALSLEMTVPWNVTMGTDATWATTQQHQSLDSRAMMIFCCSRYLGHHLSPHRSLHNSQLLPGPASSAVGVIPQQGPSLVRVERPTTCGRPSSLWVLALWSHLWASLLLLNPCFSKTGNCRKCSNWRRSDYQMCSSALF